MRSESDGVNQKILLSGRPGCGKTTLVKRLVNYLAQSAGGFYTEEIRDRGTRVGFRLRPSMATKLFLLMLRSKARRVSENIGLIFPRSKRLASGPCAKPCKGDGWS